jgi:hypothetical protein
MGHFPPNVEAHHYFGLKPSEYHSWGSLSSYYSQYGQRLRSQQQPLLGMTGWVRIFGTRCDPYLIRIILDWSLMAGWFNSQLQVVILKAKK